MENPTEQSRVLATMAVAKGSMDILTAVPFIGGVVGGIGSLHDRFAPAHPSQELLCMREQFARLENQLTEMKTVMIQKLDRIQEGVERIKLQVDARPFYTEYNQMRFQIKFLDDEIRHLVAVNWTREQLDRTVDACEASSPSDPYKLLKQLEHLVVDEQVGPDFMPSLLAASDDVGGVFAELYEAITSDIALLSVLHKICSQILITSTEPLRAQVNRAMQPIKNIRDSIFAEELKRQRHTASAMLQRAHCCEYDLASSNPDPPGVSHKMWRIKSDFNNKFFMLFTIVNSWNIAGSLPTFEAPTGYKLLGMAGPYQVLQGREQIYRAVRVFEPITVKTAMSDFSINLCTPRNPDVACSRSDNYCRYVNNIGEPGTMKCRVNPDGSYDNYFE